MNSEFYAPTSSLLSTSSLPHLHEILKSDAYDPHVHPSTAVTLVTKQCWWVNVDFKFCHWQPPHPQGPTPPGPAFHGKALWEGSQHTQDIQGTLERILVSAGASEHHQGYLQKWPPLVCRLAEQLTSTLEQQTSGASFNLRSKTPPFMTTAATRG